MFMPVLGMYMGIGHEYLRAGALGPIVMVVAVLFLAGCAPSLDLGVRAQTARGIAARASLQPRVYSSSTFDLQSFGRVAPDAAEVTVYIEGDGLAFLSRDQVSADPTPLRPLALELAARDPAENVIYLARPCQYVRASACGVDVWTAARFSPSVISAYNTALDQIRRDQPTAR